MYRFTDQEKENLVSFVEFIKLTTNKLDVLPGLSVYEPRPSMVFTDGATLIVQAGEDYHCTPRVNGLDHYDSVNVVSPYTKISELSPYRGDGSEYLFVPSRVIENIAEKHGGILHPDYKKSMNRNERQEEER